MNVDEPLNDTIISVDDHTVPTGNGDDIPDFSTSDNDNRKPMSSDDDDSSSTTSDEDESSDTTSDGGNSSSTTSDEDKSRSTTSDEGEPDAKKSRQCKPVVVRLDVDPMITCLSVRKTVEAEPTGNFSCNNCDKKFGDKRQLRQHLKYCCRLYDFRCPYCDFKLREFSGDMLEHLRRRHRKSEQYCRASFESSTNTTSKFVTHNQPADPNRFSCSKCPSSFISQSRLKSHVRSECRQKVVCLWCRALFCKTCDLRTHCDTVHRKNI